MVSRLDSSSLNLSKNSSVPRKIESSVLMNLAVRHGTVVKHIVDLVNYTSGTARRDMTVLNQGKPYGDVYAKITEYKEKNNDPFDYLKLKDESVDYWLTQITQFMQKHSEDENDLFLQKLLYLGIKRGNKALVMATGIINGKALINYHINLYSHTETKTYLNAVKDTIKHLDHLPGKYCKGTTKALNRFGLMRRLHEVENTVRDKIKRDPYTGESIHLFTAPKSEELLETDSSMEPSGFSLSMISNKFRKSVKDSP